MQKKLSCLFILVTIFCVGCTQITETAKVIWGSSTADLEKARKEAMSKTFKCTLEECFDAVSSLEYRAKNKELVAEGVFDIFIKDRKKALMVVMGIKGSESMTEVGIFFTPPSLNDISGSTRIEISSLSHLAKEKCAGAIFTALATKFSEIKPAP